MDASSIGIATAFVAGIVSFLSPCVLPLVPGYVSYIAGQGGNLSHAIPLKRDGRWLESETITLYAWDSGTNDANLQGGEDRGQSVHIHDAQLRADVPQGRQADSAGYSDNSKDRLTGVFFSDAGSRLPTSRGRGKLAVMFSGLPKKRRPRSTH